MYGPDSPVSIFRMVMLDRKEGRLTRDIFLISFDSMNSSRSFVL